MKIYIPSYKRPDKQKTVAYLTKIGCPPENIVICVQTADDYKNYTESLPGYTVKYKPAAGVSGNRNNALSYAEKHEKLLMMDDDIEKLMIFKGGKYRPIETYQEFNAAIGEAFDYCELNNAKVFCTSQNTNEFYSQNKAQKTPFELNKKGGGLFGIIKTERRFDETLNTKEDYDFLLQHISARENTVLTNKILLKIKYNQEGGCHEAHNESTERKTARILKDKYPHLVEIKKETEIVFARPIAETYTSPRWTAEIADCSLPVTLDTYSNCAFGCVYCFSQYQRGVGAAAEDYFQKKVKAISIDKIKKLFTGEMPDSQFWPYIKERRPIQYGGLSDQFDGFEKKYGKTYEVLKFLREINYPICFSTKSAWVFSDPKYQELFRGADNWNVKFSIITLDEEDAKHIEVGVPSPKKRLEAMRIYNSLSKGGTTLRLRPFIIGVSDKTYLDLIRAAADAGASAVTTEFFCLEMRSINVAREHYRAISERCGFDIVEFYRKYSNGSGYLRLNRKIKEGYVHKMQDLCHELGMRFYVSDAHFKELCDSTCCCALPSDWQYSRGHFAAALQIAKKTGKVQWKDIERDMDFLNFTAVRAEGCQIARSSSESAAHFAGMTMKDYLRYLWNAPKRGQSPYKLFEKVLVPNGYDEDGNIIYYYNKSVTFQEHGNEKEFNLMQL